MSTFLPRGAGRSRLPVTAGAVLLGLVLSTGGAFAQASGQTGLLKCNVEGGWGLLIGSKKGMKCVYEPSGKGQKHAYTGSIGRLGIDIGKTKKSVMVWGVVQSGENKSGGPLQGDAIAGKYGGIGAEAAVVFGVGAKALLGGSKNSIALQPISVSGQQGLNLALGVEGLTLKYTGPAN